jgi:cell division septation protein DedD
VVLAALFISLPSRSARSKGADSRDAPSKSAQSNALASARAGEPVPQASARSTTPSSITPAAPSVDRLEAVDSFLVTVASFKGPQRAGEVVDQLKRKGLPAFARQGTGWFVVVIGPYVSREEADDVRRQVGSAGYADSHVEKQSAAGPRS